MRIEAEVDTVFARTIAELGVVDVLVATSAADQAVFLAGDTIEVNGVAGLYRHVRPTYTEPSMIQSSCVYCTRVSENVIWSDERCRVLHIADSPFAGLCRVVWDSHVAEFSDLDEDARSHLIEVVVGVEKALREMLMPAKINLASMGTMVPHLHWHVVPRYRDDSHYPEAIWAAPQREGVVRPLPDDFAVRIKQSLDAAMA